MLQQWTGFFSATVNCQLCALNRTHLERGCLKVCLYSLTYCLLQCEPFICSTSPLHFMDNNTGVAFRLWISLISGFWIPASGFRMLRFQASRFRCGFVPQFMLQFTDAGFRLLDSAAISCFNSRIRKMNTAVQCSRFPGFHCGSMLLDHSQSPDAFAYVPGPTLTGGA